MTTLAYDSPVWFYVLMAPVFLALGGCLCVVTYLAWKDIHRD